MARARKIAARRRTRRMPTSPAAPRRVPVATLGMLAMAAARTIQMIDPDEPEAMRVAGLLRWAIGRARSLLLREHGALVDFFMLAADRDVEPPEDVLAAVSALGSTDAETTVTVEVLDALAIGTAAGAVTVLGTDPGGVMLLTDRETVETEMPWMSRVLVIYPSLSHKARRTIADLWGIREADIAAVRAAWEAMLLDGGA